MMKKKIKRHSDLTIALGLGVVLFLAFLGIAQGYFLYSIWQLRENFPKSTALIDLREQALSEKKGKVNRRYHPVALEKIAKILVRAVLVGEDARFFKHRGIDFTELSSAITRNKARPKRVRGASTISQQLVKNLFLSPKKNMIRKAIEAVLTLEMECLLTKRRILELYLNIIEFGDQVYGVEAAARYYFHRSADRVDLDQAAFLAAIIPGPLGAYHPLRKPRKVAWRKKYIIEAIGDPVLPRDWSKKPKRVR